MTRRFSADSVEFVGELTVALPVEQAFQLFSPLGEKGWVPDWDPELVHPPGTPWERGQIFRTREQSGDAVWIVTALDREKHDVEYHRVEPGHYVARVRVTCTPSSARQTHVSVAYRFVGLSDGGNAAILAMNAADYREKMRRWERWIGERVDGGGIV